MTWQIDGQPIRSVLVSRQRYLGDIVMATVVLEALRRGDPDLRLGFLCEAGHGPVLERQQGLDDLFLLHRRRKGRDAAARGVTEAAPGGPAEPGDGPGIHHARGSGQLLKQLRSADYDLVVDLFFNPYSAWLLRFSGIPFRIGGTPKWRRRLYTHTVTRRDQQVRESALERLAPGGLGEHLCRLAPLTHVETGLPFLDWLQVEWPDGPIMPRLAERPDPEETCAALEGIGVGQGEDFLLLAPGATWPAKEWPLDNWRDLIRRLLPETSLPLAVLLPPVRSARWCLLAEEIHTGRGGVLPAMVLTEVLDVIGRCAGLVSVDGGVLHAGVGLGRPTLGLFGPTDPAIWFPYTGGGPYRVLAEAPDCHPCDLHECGEFICLPRLTASRVCTAALALVRDISSPGRGW